jgi:hypothetical protein
MTTARAIQTVAAFRTLPVLTISDLEGFTDAGGIVRLLFEHGQLRFMIGLDSARRAGLQLSAKLLTLAIRK